MGPDLASLQTHVRPPSLLVEGVRMAYKKRGAPAQGMLLRQPKLPADTLDQVEKHEALLIVKKLVVEAVGSFAENRPQYLVRHCVLQYTSSGHGACASFGPGLGVLQHRRGHFFYQHLYYLIVLVAGQVQ
jgi:hypothetical protein